MSSSQIPAVLCLGFMHHLLPCCIAWWWRCAAHLQDDLLGGNTPTGTRYAIFSAEFNRRYVQSLVQLRVCKCIHYALWFNVRFNNINPAIPGRNMVVAYQYKNVHIGLRIMVYLPVEYKIQLDNTPGITLSSYWKEPRNTPSGKYYKWRLCTSITKKVTFSQT